MTLNKVQIKLYAAEKTEASLESYIPAFHRFIQEGSLEELMIDVADYTHVPNGPGVLLVGHGSDYAIDQGEARPGLFYYRKRDLPQDAELVDDALQRTLKAAKLLEKDEAVEGPSGFSTDEILFRFPERIHVKNDEAGFDRVGAQVTAALAKLFPGVSYTLAREGEAREPLTIRATRA